jgi:hypothetical protein
MAERLRRSGFRDGAVFHAYHAHECAISAFLVARGASVPASHARRFVLFDQLLDLTRPYAEAYADLGFLTIPVRNRALYYDRQQNRLPSDWFDAPYLDRLMPLVHRFAQAVWQEIR